jgi:hypothetical protein
VSSNLTGDVAIMNLAIDILRFLHIGAGGLSLATGYAAMAVRAGSPRHRTLGKAYVAGMAVVTVTAVPIALWRPNPFLFGVAVFSGYFVWRAWESARNRKGEPNAVSWGVAGLLATTSALGLVASVMTFGSGLAIVGLIFSFIGLGVSVQDLRRFRAGPTRGRDRLVVHLVSSGAGLIATTTAMLVTVGRYLPGDLPAPVLWLGPTVLVTPLLIRWSGQLQRGELKM